MISKHAPELQVSHWLNTDAPLMLEKLKGRVVLIEAFQMLCPGCVSHGLPQAQRVANTFSQDDVVVIGLHTVFEHHEAQGTQKALAAFLHEYRVNFPVAIDAPDGTSRIPKTMATYELRGTPSLILIDRLGCVRQQLFGQQDDLKLGADIMALVLEESCEKSCENSSEKRSDKGSMSDLPDSGEPAILSRDSQGRDSRGCDDQGCAVETGPA